MEIKIVHVAYFKENLPAVSKLPNVCQDKQQTEKMT